MVHYIYEIKELTTNKKYIGVRSSNRPAEQDLGVYYFSSSLDVDFKQNQKNYPERYKYTVLEIFKTREEAIAAEIRLHKELDVSKNAEYFNKTNACLGFEHTGRFPAKDKEGNILSVIKEDPRYLSGELVSMFKGTVNMKDVNGNILKVSTEDPRIKTGELISIFKNKVAIRTKDKGCTFIPQEDFNPEIHAGLNKNKITVKDKNNNTFQINKDDPQYLSGELVGITKGVKLTEEHKEKISKAVSGVNHPNYGKKFSEITKQKISEKAKNRDKSTYNGKHVIIDGVHYESLSAAGLIFNVNKTTIKNRCLSNKPEWINWVLISL